MFSPFQHYVSYGSTDQQTMRDLSGYYDGLLVPGTIAAFQAEGTKGFVLSLSARSAEPYAIDSRFPLFQNRLAHPKKSHAMLADVLGRPDLIREDRAPVPSDFSDEMVETLAKNWIDFNLGFDDVKTKTFDKYALRLGEPVLPENRHAPAFILPPYAMSSTLDDGWWGVSQQIWAASVDYATGRGAKDSLRRVVAATNADLWGSLAEATEDAQLVGWVSNLDEFRVTSESQLVLYGHALRRLKENGQSVFALYGGFFSVLLGRYGLTGASHGIGYGEHRDWVELPSSGAPAARYYVPRLHRYIGVDIALAIWRQYPQLIACECADCNGGSPASLDYHALMRHSVRCRATEISEWLDKPSEAVIADLHDNFLAFRSALDNLDAAPKIVRRAEDIHLHLETWARVMASLDV